MGCDKNTLACLHTKVRRDILGHLYFGWLFLYLSLVLGPCAYHTLHCESLPMSQPGLAAGFTAWRTGQGTNKHELCVRNMRLDHLTTLQLCVFCLISVVTLDAVTFIVGARVARLHTIKRLRILLLRAFDHHLTPKLLFSARLGLVIQQYGHEMKCDVILNYGFVHG